MGLFSAIDVNTLSVPTLRTLLAVCNGMVLESDAEVHHDDYKELATRLSNEVRKREEQAATQIQSVFRGMQARKEAEELRKKKEEEEQQRLLLERQNKAAIAIQSAFRKHQAEKALEALKEQQKLKTQQQIAKADEALKDKINPALADPEMKLKLGELIEIYEKAKAASDAFSSKDKKLPARTARGKTTKASEERDQALLQIVTLVKEELAAKKKIADAARTIKFPADFRQNGALVDYDTFLYPGAGELTIAAKSYQLHPNRSLVHVKHEIKPKESLAWVQAYFNSLIAACRKVITDNKSAPVDVMSGKIRVDDKTPDGRSFYWNVMYKRLDPNKQQRGFAGSIEHIDSGYENSRWRRS